MKVNYLDGRDPVTVLASPRAQVETERHYGGITESRQVEASYYLAWASLHYAGKEPAEFEVWLNQVAEVEQAEPEVVDPTQTTLPPTTSPA